MIDRFRWSAAVAAAAAAAVLGAGACLPSEEAPTALELDVLSVEALIEETQASRTPSLDVGDAVCPAGIPAEVGYRFDCTLDIGGGGYLFLVEVVSVSGRSARYEIRPERPIVALEEVADFVRRVLGPGWEQASVSCGEGGPVISVDPGTVLRCPATVGERTRRVQVEVVDPDGRLSASEIVGGA